MSVVLHAVWTVLQGSVGKVVAWVLWLWLYLKFLFCELGVKPLFVRWSCEGRWLVRIGACSGVYAIMLSRQ